MLFSWYFDLVKMTDIFSLQRSPSLAELYFWSRVLGRHFSTSGSIHWEKCLSGPSTMAVARTPLSLSLAQNKVVAAACKPASHGWGPSAGWWENEHVKKCSHLRLPFSIGLIVCSADIAFPHFLGFLSTFLFYPSLNNCGEPLTLEYILGWGGQSLWPPPRHYWSSPCSSLVFPVFIMRPLLLLTRV